jgi:transposase
MTRKRKPYKTYTKEFKEEAVRLMASSNRPNAEVCC